MTLRFLMGWHQQHQGAGTVRGILVASDFLKGCSTRPWPFRT